jgi:hypothetical protein
MNTSITRREQLAPRCALCGRLSLQPPQTGSDWHTFSSKGRLLHVCDAHFYPDHEAGETFEQRYSSVLKKLGIPF